MKTILVERALEQLQDPVDTELEFEEALRRSELKKTFSGRLKALFVMHSTVAVPLELAKQYPAGMKTLGGKPLWTFTQVGEEVFSLRPTETISHL